MAKSRRRSTRRAERRPARKAAIRGTAARKTVRKAAATRRPSPPPVSVSLEKVAHRALLDQTFFRALGRNVDQTLARENWQLRPREVAILKQSLRGRLGAPTRVVLHPRRMFQVLHRLPPDLFDTLSRAWGIGWGEPPPERSRARLRRKRT